jgi:hypothetical protein
MGHPGVRRRARAPADPETAGAVATIGRYESMLMALAEAGDRWAPERLRMVWWTRREIDEWGLDVISRLRVQGYAREIERLTGTAPAEIRPAVHWLNGPPAGEAG